jgi:hypothetical protein
VPSDDLVGLPALEDLSTTVPRKNVAVRVEQQYGALFHSRQERGL